MHLDINLIVQTLLCAVLLALGKWVWNQSILVATLTSEFRDSRAENERAHLRYDRELRDIRRAA